MEHAKLLEPSRLLDFGHKDISALVVSRNWRALPPFEAVGAVYDFVRNDILFGYNARDDIPASQVLREGIGQCNTKAILLMALLRALSIPCRLRGFTIHKELQRGIVPELIYPITPENILHSWVEIFLKGKWINLEGFILDQAFLRRLQETFSAGQEGFCGYGAGTANLAAPSVEWTGNDTYIQNMAINNDFGLFDTPDDFYARHQQDFPWWKRALYARVIRHWMNFRVRQIRAGRTPARLPPAACQTARKIQGEVNDT